MMVFFILDDRVCQKFETTLSIIRQLRAELRGRAGIKRRKSTGKLESLPVSHAPNCGGISIRQLVHFFASSRPRRRSSSCPGVFHLGLVVRLPPRSYFLITSSTCPLGQRADLALSSPGVRSNFDHLAWAHLAAHMAWPLILADE